MKTIRSAIMLWIGMAVAVGCCDANGADAAETMGEQLVVQPNNKFALELYAKLRTKQGNLFLSPYSISTALAMTYSGARGQTASQMATVLQFPLERRKALDSDNQGRPFYRIESELISPERIAAAFGGLQKALNARGAKGGYELTVANALWGQKGYGFLKEFQELTQTHYDGKLNELDFVAAAEAARNTINAWVEKKTKDKIKDLIGPGVLDRMTRLVLTNAIYFKGNWASQFKEEKTAEAPFTLANGEKVNAPMMNQTARFNYMEAEDFQGLELPYVDNELSMIILLPRRLEGLSDLEKTLTSENLAAWTAKLRKREVIVSIPKFKMTSQFSLASVLKSMGMTDAFTANADFSGMTGKKELFISAVIHKAFVEVNEEGTEAAAATGVAMRLTAAVPDRTPVFRADHPFLFLIRDNISGSILFIGRLMNPAT